MRAWNRYTCCVLIDIVTTDITELRVDAIVNAANETLLGGGGVDGAIHRAAGPHLLTACRALPEVRPYVRCPTGEARLTPGFDLPADYIIHTVGPVWHGGSAGEPALLAGCYQSSLQLAAAHRLNSIAFPAVSCGVFGYPLDAAAQIVIGVLREHLAGDNLPRKIILCAFGTKVEAALRNALATPSTGL